MSGADAEANESQLLAELEREMAACRPLAPELPVVADSAARDRAIARLGRERGLAAQLRSLPGPWRMLLVAALALVTTLAALLLSPRPDLQHYPGARMTVVLVLLFAFTATACWRLLRPLHRAPTSPALDLLLLIAGAALPAALAMVPIDHAGTHPGEGAAFLVNCGKCLAYGAVLGLPVLAVAVLARRANVGGPAVAALAGVAAGLTGNLVLQVHCPITAAGHVLLGHASLLAPLGLAAVWWMGRRRAVDG